MKRTAIISTTFSLATLAAATLAVTLPLLAKDEEPRGNASSPSLDSVDSVLDRLERRLLDQEADGLTFGERNEPPPAMQPADQGAKYKYEGKGGDAAIKASTTERDQMASLGAAVAELETQVDQLASNVQKTKQAILDEASMDNFVAIEAELGETDAAAIKTLNIKLDGYPVYELHEASGLWLPSKAVPLYSGPLQPGAHRVDLEARIVVRHNQSLPMNADVYRFVNKSFDINVPGGTSNTRYVIAIKPPAKLEEQADAVIKEID